MEKIVFKDGTVIEAERNGSCFIVDAKPEFPTDLTGIVITGETSGTIDNGNVVECASIDGRYWFTIIEESPEDLEKKALIDKLNEQNDAIMELSEILASMMQ